MHTILKGQNKSIIGGLDFMDFSFPVNQVVYSKTSKIRFFKILAYSK